MTWWLVGAALLIVMALARRGPVRPLPPGWDTDELPEQDPDAIALLAIEDAIDLHGFQPREITSVVESYLEAAVQAGFDEVRLIHGRGKGVQRTRVRKLLRSHPDVLKYVDAPAHRGGWGAQIVTLKSGAGPPAQTP